MAIALRGSGQGSLAAATTFTIPLPVTTNAGDCIVIAICQQGTPTLTGSGGGATWVTALDSKAYPPQAVILVGYNASAGQTSVTVTSSASYMLTYAVGVLSGVLAAASPVIGANTASDSATFTAPLTVTTPTIPVLAQQAVVAICGDYGVTGWGATTWSDGQTTTSLGANTGTAREVAADMIVATECTTVSATYTISSGGSQGIQLGILTLTPAAYSVTGTSNMAFGGSASGSVTIPVTGSSHMTLAAGTATAKVTIPVAGTGHMTFGGSATARVTVPASGTGHLTFAGNTPAQVTEPTIGTGHLSFAGRASAHVVVPVTAHGAMTLAGRGSAVVIVSASGTGHMVFGGSATAAVRPLTASGHMTFAGSATATVKVPVTGSGHMTFAGRAAAAVPSAVVAVVIYASARYRTLDAQARTREIDASDRTRTVEAQ